MIINNDLDDNSKISSSSSAFASKAGRDTELPSAVAALLNRSAQVRRDSSDSRSTTPTTGSRNTRFSRSNTVDDPRSDKSSSVYQKSPLNKKPSEQITSNKGDDKAYRTRIGLLDDDDGHNSYLSSGPTAHSRFLSRSKTSSAIASTNRTNNFDDSQPEDTRYSSYSRRESLRSFKDPQTVPGGSTGSASSAYQSSFARSRSSHKIGGWSYCQKFQISSTFLSSYTLSSHVFLVFVFLVLCFINYFQTKNITPTSLLPPQMIYALN